MEVIAAWEIWALIVVLMGIAAMIIGDVTFVAVALAAVFASVAAYVGWGRYAQLAVFAAATCVLWPVFYYYLRSDARKPGVENIGSGGAAGRQVQIVIRDGVPMVKLDGHFYPASDQGGGELVDGQTVVVREVAGITAIVTIQQ